ncbi:MAG: hypothetical protein H7Y19_10175 [Luteimonas sp.]|nr:hypothetical protein [Luteimonas sp.]
MFSADAQAEKMPCETNYKQEGSFFSGRRFTTWEEVAGVAPDKAFKLVYADAVKSGLKIVSTDKEMGAISLEQNQTLNGAQVSLPWNVLVEESGGGSKISVSKMTPSGYATGQDYQIKSMCAVIETVRK